METPKIKLQKVVHLPKVTIELENGSYLYDKAEESKIMIKLDGTDPFPMYMIRSQLFELHFLLTKYLELRYKEDYDKRS